MLFFLFACVQDLTPPFLGECAEYPEGKFDYGQVGIGTCISGPSDLYFIENEGETKLLISNANPYLNFETGSILLLDWESIDFEKRTQYVHNLATSTHLTPNSGWVSKFQLMRSADVALHNCQPSC